MGSLGFAPSEVRDMTPHEIMAVVRIKQGQTKQTAGIDYEELLQDLREAKKK